MLYTSIRLFGDEATYVSSDEQLSSHDIAHFQMTLDCAQDAVGRLRVAAGSLDPKEKERIGGPMYERYMQEAEARWLAAVQREADPDDHGAKIAAD